MGPPDHRRLPAVAAERKPIYRPSRLRGAALHRPGGLRGGRHRPGPGGCREAEASPAGHGATWLSGQFTGGLVHNPNFGGFDDYGLTIDTVFALQSVGGHQPDVRTARNALAANVDNYMTGDSFGDIGSTYAGSTGEDSSCWRSPPEPTRRTSAA